ncbi:MAG TPA: hypothetical protein VMR70_15320 [Flavisolibacter sp.]|nr:hypothetical protein [Flavisolibacter sp.]
MKAVTSASTKTKQSLKTFSTNPFQSYFFDEDAASPEAQLMNKIVRYKKKYKRTISSSCAPRPVVREVDRIPQNIYIKETYSKPFFVSPLHRFLFRLTPF